MRRQPRHARITGLRALEMLRTIERKRGQIEAASDGVPRVNGAPELRETADMLAEHIRADLVKARRK